MSLVGGYPGVPMSHTHTVKIRGHVLYPKHMNYSKYSKCRCSSGREPDGIQLGLGRYGTKSSRAGRLSYRAIEATRRATIRQFHRAMSGQFRRKYKIWYIKIISIVLVVPC
jgi:large subunit ribosomal protein L16